VARGWPTPATSWTCSSSSACATSPTSRPRKRATCALRRRRRCPPGGSTWDRSIAGPEEDLALRIYRPQAGSGTGALVYFHGGGWVIGDLDSHDETCRRLCRDAGITVVAVHYRRAPETTYPGAVDDCYAATCWVADHAAELGIDAGRIAVGGDSAGGNLAAAVALMARDRGAPGTVLSAADLPGHRRGLRHRLVSRQRRGLSAEPPRHAVVLGPVRAGPISGASHTPRRWPPTTCPGCRRRWCRRPSTIRCATKAKPSPRRSSTPA
jgi:hypothetical protein